MYILCSLKVWDTGLSPPPGCAEEHRKFGLTSLVLEDSKFMKRELFIMTRPENSTGIRQVKRRKRYKCCLIYYIHMYSIFLWYTHMYMHVYNILYTETYNIHRKLSEQTRNESF